MFVGLAVPLYEPAPVPDHDLKKYPVVAVALICAPDPALYHPLGGLTVPPVLAVIVR
jgi:hypothetical protein